MVFEFVFPLEYIDSPVTDIGHDAPAGIIVETVAPPAWRNLFDKVSDDAVGVHSFHLAEVRIHARQERFDIPFTNMLVPEPNLHPRSVYDGPRSVDTARLEGRADE